MTEALLAMGQSRGAHLVRDRKSSLIEGDDHLAVRPHFKIVRQRDDRFHWELINPHATTAARSMETFATEDDAAANAEYAQRLISRAPIERP
jgi:hypothetical protein